MTGLTQSNWEKSPEDDDDVAEMQQQNSFSDKSFHSTVRVNTRRCSLKWKRSDNFAISRNGQFINTPTCSV